jgi:hypothetical protein
MTTPPPPQQAPVVIQVTAATEAALATEAATVLAYAVTIEAALFYLRPRFRSAGIMPDALRGALEVVMGMPPERGGAYGPATARILRMNLARRAQFLVASARRLTADLRDARSRDENALRALADGITRERRYYGQHMQAIWNRMDAAAAVDSASMLYGRLLGWNTVLDSRTSPECRLADRHNFLADRMPLIGYPGMVHPHCRCWPSRPFPGAAILPSETGLLRRLVAA